ncbi:MAG: hypothetical protein JO184_02675 [Gammaproteobacteria bacterium]|nr:hypothetical protein [Gammaproteobacteria bacterium]MBV8403501.1 hypothetical protein [Gammaproteobacteria bacterium]
MRHAYALKILGIFAMLALAAPALRAQSFAPVGNLDCNGYSAIQKPLKRNMTCSDYFNAYSYQRGYDNGHYIGHDEPSIGFISTVPHSGNNLQWDITLPRERPLPATQTFENQVAFWFALAMCDPNSYPTAPCIPDSDENNPSLAGSAFLELQFYPPGFPPFITQISCDLTHWCAALNIDSLELMSTGGLNPNCTEPVNFAWIQTDGVPTGPPGPANANSATLTPNAHTLLMNQGDHLRITIKDTPSGLVTRVEDLTTGQSGYMVASAANGFQNTDPNTCAGTNFNFHPLFDTAKFGNFVNWAALQANVNFAVEIGHFTPGVNGDNDADDAPCFPGPTVAGCLGADVDFDGTSYRFDWPDGTANNATSLAIRSVAGSGIGPLSRSGEEGRYDRPYPIVYLETDVSASESTCQPNGVGCVVPPAGAQFYPFYSLENSGSVSTCALVFGNITGPGVNTFGRDKGWGPANLPWFFGQNTSGPRANPCIPPTGGDSD